MTDQNSEILMSDFRPGNEPNLQRAQKGPRGYPWLLTRNVGSKIRNFDGPSSSASTQGVRGNMCNPSQHHPSGKSSASTFQTEDWPDSETDRQREKSNRDGARERERETEGWRGRDRETARQSQKRRETAWQRNKESESEQCRGHWQSY